jgi:hypothetical protein
MVHRTVYMLATSRKCGIMDYEAWAEAWVRKKPRIVIHDQFLILLLDICGIVLPWVAAGTCFWLIIVLKNFLFGVTIFATWTTAFLIYTALRMYVIRENRKNVAYKPL